MLFGARKVSTSIIWLGCRLYTPQKEQQIPSAHQNGMQGRTAESTANRSNDPPRTLRSAFKKGCALLSQISLGMNFQFQGLNKDTPTHTQQEILLLCNILVWFFFGLP